MNQILVAEKLYITPELRKKKRLYKIDFFISIFLIIVLSSYYIYAEYDKNKGEEQSQEILASLTFQDNAQDDTTIKFSDNAQIVILNSEDPFEVIYTRPAETVDTGNQSLPIDERVTDSGERYHTIAVVSVPSIDIEYPILDHWTDELLKISPCYFWGAEPNQVGNFCIVGHNYRNKKFFSKVPTLEPGEEIIITDLTQKKITYEIYDVYVVEPDNVESTTQLTNGMREVTLITCTNDSSKRVIVKAREKF
jgi:LPXTG-site transpeptidase (sortase) family protein